MEEAGLPFLFFVLVLFDRYRFCPMMSFWEGFGDQTSHVIRTIRTMRKYEPRDIILSEEFFAVSSIKLIKFLDD